MADQNNYFSSMVNSLMESTGAVLTSRTVVGDPVIVGDTTIIPLSDVTIGCGAGANTDEKKGAGGGGVSAKMSPNSVLIVRGGHVRVVNIKTQDALTKLVDLVPDIVDKISAGKASSDTMGDDEAVDRAFPAHAKDKAENKDRNSGKKN